MVPELPDDASTIDWSWHDNMIFGLHLRSPDPERRWWHSELILDIDHIVEWVQRERGRCMWRIAPATLVFDWVSDLRINVDFTADALSNAITEWSIDQVERVLIPSEKPEANYRWRILLNAPQGGEIAFHAHGHTLTLRGEPQFFDEARRQYRPPLILT
jgi:hypothetical protein